MLSEKRILIAPLDWGLGHATRCIPIIRLLLQCHAKVIIAADGRPLALLKKEFPELQFITLSGYSISYPNKGGMLLKMMLSVPRILIGIVKEHQALKTIVKQKNIDVVISDNRFGLWNKQVKSIFITHQLMIKSPFGENVLQKINAFFIRQYNECWVPDYTGTISFSGDLSHKYPIGENVFFVGPLSRFNDEEYVRNDAFEYDVMAIVSGPEPQRTLFENSVLAQLKRSNLKALMVCGKTEAPTEKKQIGTIDIISHLPAKEMKKAILSSKVIVARSGYSTIMDMAELEKKCVFVPTPGQTEQEYLATKLLNENTAFCQAQNTFNLIQALKQNENFKGLKKEKDTNNLLMQRAKLL